MVAGSAPKTVECSGLEIKKNQKDTVMAHWKTERFADYLKKNHQVQPINCKKEHCPRHAICGQIPSLAKYFGKTQAKVFFIGDSSSPDERELQIASCNQAGKLMHDTFIRTFVRDTGMSVPYLITKSFRADGPAKVYEASLCFEHLLWEIREHRPEVLVVFGATSFGMLYAHAVNKEELPTKHEQTPQNLRGRFFDFQFEEAPRVKVFVAFPPGSVLTAPITVHYLIEDAHALASHWFPALKKLQPSPLEIESIDNLETAKDVFDYLDFLKRGLPPKSPIAFDTETENLNRVHNNRFLTWQFCHAPGKAVVFPIEHRSRPLFEDPALKAKLIEKTNEMFNSTPEETNIPWVVGHNIKYDLSVLWGLMGILPRRSGCIPWWCTMLGMHWLDENRKSRQSFLPGSPYSLKTLGIELFNFFFEEESLEKRGDGSLEMLTLDQIFTYGGSDAILTRAIARKQIELAQFEREQETKKIIEAEKTNVIRQGLLKPGNPVETLQKFQKYYYFPASRALAVMECNGLYVKPDQLQYLQSEESPIWTRLSEIERELQNLPDVLAFRRRFKDKIDGAKKGSAKYESLWNFDNEDDDLPELDLNKAEHQKLFFLDFLNLPPIRMSKKTGKPSFNNAFLEHYARPTVWKETPTIKEQFYAYYGVPSGTDEKEGTPIYRDNPIKLAIEYRKLKKLGTSYLDSIEGFLRNKRGDCTDSRIRSSYQIHGTDTGRMSSRDPNMQQLPSGKIKLAKEVKNLFQAEPPSKRFPQGTCLIQGDYKTAEVRWAALFSNDKNLISVFAEAGKIIEAAIADDSITDKQFEDANLAADLHRRTASLMFNMPPEKVPKALRQASKAITFGLLFGMSPKTLGERQGWTLEEAEEKLRIYFSAFPDLEQWLKSIPRIAEARGYVETFMGRRRRLDHLFMLDDWKARTDAERKAMNSSIQGQSSDAGTIGMFTFLQYILDNNLEDRWLIQNIVHDSCLVQVPKEDVRIALPIMKRCFVKDMQRYIEERWNCSFAIPIEFEFELGLKYGDLKTWDGRQKTLDKILVEIDNQAKDVWKNVQLPSKPPKALDFVTLEEGE